MASSLSGKFGVVNGQTNIRNWSTDRTSTPEIYIDSTSEFGQYVNAGVEDHSGSFEGFGEGPPATIFPGKVFTFLGYTAPDTNVYGDDGVTVSFEAIVDTLTLNWDWTPGGSHSWSVGFSMESGDITIGSGQPDDTGSTVPPRMCLNALQTGAALSEADWSDIVSATLTISAANIPYVTSSTACRTARRAGNISWTLSVVEQNTAEKFAVGSNTRFRIETDGGTDYWILEWGHLESITGLRADRESGAIIERTYNFIMNGNVGGTLGQIIHPDGTVLWPLTQTV